MSSTFPTTLDDSADLPTDIDPTDPTTAPSHAGQHNTLSGAVVALEAKVGVDGSGVTTSLDHLVKAATDPGHTHTPAVHDHDAAYVNEGDHTKAAHDALNVDADTLDGLDSAAFALVNAAAGGDLSGNYPNPTVVDDGHAHTGTTLSAIPETDISDGALLARVGSAETITAPWTFGEATFLDKGNLVYDVKAYGALGDNATNDTAGIQAAIDAANANGGGIVWFPPGTYLSNKLTLYSKVSLHGASPEASIIKLLNTQNTALLTTNGFVTTDASAGIYAFVIQDLSFDGNKANQTSNADSGLVQIYGYGFELRNVQIYAAEGVGLYSNWGTAGGAPGPNGIGMEANLQTVSAHDCGTDGFYWNGPHDSVWSGCLAYNNGAIGYHIGARGNGVEAVNCHSWGSSQTYAWYLEGSACHLVNCQGEGASINQVWIGASDTTIVGGNYYAAGGGTTGIVLGAAVGGLHINTKVLNFTTAALALGANDAGGNMFVLTNYSLSGATISGTLHATSVAIVAATGGATGAGATLSGDVTIPATASYKIGTDVSLYRNAANVLRTDDSLLIVRDATNAFEIFGAAVTLLLMDSTNKILHLSSDTVLRFWTDNFANIALQILGDSGQLQWGAAQDTNLYRSAADLLATDDSLAVALQLILSGNGSNVDPGNPWLRGGGDSLVVNPSAGGILYLAFDAGTGGIAFGDGAGIVTGKWKADGALAIKDGIPAPATDAGFASIYVDTADGDLKVKFGDGVVKTLVEDQAAGSTLTIAAGAITATTPFHAVDTEAAAASDDLDTINGGVIGMVLVVHAANSARTVVAKNGTGNLKLEGDMTLDNAEDTLQLIHDGTNWLELSRSNNGA